MHELTLVQSIFDIIEDYQKKHNFKKVNSVILEFGTLSCVNEEALKFTFKTFSTGTIAEKCKLYIKKLPPKIFCNYCNRESIVDENFSKCPFCGEENIYLIGGLEELKITEIEVEF